MACTGKLSLAATSLLLVAFIPGCAGVTDKATVGEGAGIITGGLVGGAIGEKVGGKGGMIAGLLIGSVVGGMIGHEIGHSLDEADRAAMRKQMALALVKGRDGEAFKWTSSKNKATAEFSPDKARNEQRKTVIVRPSNLDPTPPLDVIGEPYLVKRTTKLFSGPRTNGAVVGQLSKGQQVVAMARVKGQPWIAVGHDNQVIGYVSETAIVALSDPSAASFERSLTASSKRPPQEQIVRTAATSGMLIDQVDASTSCRKLNFKVVKDGAESEKGEVDACKAIDGGWTHQG